MNDKNHETVTPAAKRASGPRLQHVVARKTDPNMNSFDEVIIHGQEIDALRSIVGKPDWVYAAVAHGQNFTDALKASS